MSEVRYSKDHEWVKIDGDTATVGITHYAQEQLGDVVFVELPEVGKKVEQGKELATVESVKAASEVYAPISGEVVEVNSALSRCARHRQRGGAGQGLVRQAQDRRQGPARRPDGRGRLQEIRRGTALMRYLPLTDDDRRAMLATVGAPSVDSLYSDVPQKVRLTKPVDLPPFKSELEVERHLSALAAKNLGAGSCPSFLGAGAYRHHIPASVDHLIQRGEFLTSYTPYQPEVTQGTLQYLFEFQTQVAMLTGMDVANASMYDGATATCEAVTMANRVTRRSRAVLSGGLHPHYREVIETHGKFTGFEVAAAPADAKGSGRSHQADRCQDLLRGGAEPQLLRPRPRSDRARQGLPRRRRAAGGGGDGDRVARPGHAARRDGRGHRRRRKASRSACRSASAGPMSACSRPATSSSARCRAASPARPSMSTASAAGC